MSRPRVRTSSANNDIDKPVRTRPAPPFPIPYQLDVSERRLEPFHQLFRACQHYQLQSHYHCQLSFSNGTGPFARRPMPRRAATWLLFAAGFSFYSYIVGQRPALLDYSRESKAPSESSSPSHPPRTLLVLSPAQIKSGNLLDSCRSPCASPSTPCASNSKITNLQRA
jgi:hypothetical protein